jgi:dynein assembly factor with WDR repeat domains 1
LRCFDDHADEVLDIAFNPTGTLLASASADSQAILYSVGEASTISKFMGHKLSVSKVLFNP